MQFIKGPNRTLSLCTTAHNYVRFSIYIRLHIYIRFSIYIRSLLHLVFVELQLKMRFQSIKLALLASLPLLQGAVASKWCDMPPGPYAQTRGVGLRGDTDTAGDWQCISDWQNGNLITGIEAWASEFAVEGIKFWMADGTETQWYGRGTENEHLNSHPDKPYKWDSGERVREYSSCPRKLHRGANDQSRNQTLGQQRTIERNRRFQCGWEDPSL